MSKQRVCIDCNIEKDESEFTKNKTGYRNKCKKCYNLYQREYAKNTKVANNKKLLTYLAHKLINIKNQDLKRFPDEDYELTVDDLLNIYKLQNGKCIYSNSKLRPGSDVSIYKKISFDRIDNSLPHIKTNLVMSSLFMNHFRANMEFSKFMEKINQEVVYQYSEDVHE
jgi:hypothetical protein